MSKVPALPLPTTLREAVHGERVRAVHAPFDRIIAVTVNAAMMSSAWFFLPTTWKDSFFTLHGSLAFAVVLCTWMYSDVPATNVIGTDAERIALAISDPVMLRRLLDAKIVMLWFLVTPFCTLIALLNGFIAGNWLATIYSIIWIVIVPPGFLAISQWMGIIYPYHPMPIRYRFTHWHPWFRMLGRWTTLITLPYVLVPFIGIALLSPSLFLWGFFAPGGFSEQLPHTYLGVGIALACLTSLLGLFGGRWAGTRMMIRRHDKLIGFLNSPTAD